MVNHMKFQLTCEKHLQINDFMKRDAIAILVSYIAVLALYYGGKAALMFLPFRLIPLLLSEIGIPPNSGMVSLVVGFLLIFLSGFLSSLISQRTRTTIIPAQVILLIFTYALIESYLVSVSPHDDFSDDWVSPTPQIVAKSVILLFIGVPAFHLGRKFSSRFIPMNLDNENLLRIT